MLSHTIQRRGLCWTVSKRRKALQDHFRRVRIKSGKVRHFVSWYYVLTSKSALQRIAPMIKHTFLRKLFSKSNVLRQPRSAPSCALPALSSTALSAKSVRQRCHRARRTNPAHSSLPVYAHHYRSYHYPYAQAYGTAPQTRHRLPQSNQYSGPTALQSPTMSLPPGPHRPHLHLLPTTPTSALPVPPTAPSVPPSSIPVQPPRVLTPCTTMPWHRARIPSHRLDCSASLPPAAVLRGSSANGQC